MSATDELRRLLDERGVEYRSDDASYTFATHWVDSLGRGCSFVEEVYVNESKTIFVSNPSAFNVTPEQTIAATLNSRVERTCHAIAIFNMHDEWCADECSMCGYEWYEDEPNYCPNCGARVEVGE